MPLVAGNRWADFFGKEPRAKTVNPDERFAVGRCDSRAVLAGVDVGKDVVLLDVSPLSLGIENHGGVRLPLIERTHSFRPRSRRCSPAADDNQPPWTIHVRRGERKQGWAESMVRFDLADFRCTAWRTARLKVSLTSTQRYLKCRQGQGGPASSSRSSSKASSG